MGVSLEWLVHVIHNVKNIWHLICLEENNMGDMVLSVSVLLLLIKNKKNALHVREKAKKILLFPEMWVAKEIFTWVAANLYFQSV